MVEISGQPLVFDGQMVLFNSARDVANTRPPRRRCACKRPRSTPPPTRSSPDRSGVIEWVNAAFSASTGYSAEETIGKNPRALIQSGLHPPEFYKEMWQTILSGRVWHGEMSNRRKDHSVYVEDVTITPVASPSGDRPLHRHQARPHRRAAAADDAAPGAEDGGRRAAAGGVAHDFNNLLSVILSYASSWTS